MANLRGWTSDEASRSEQTRQVIAELRSEIKELKETRTLLSFAVGVFFTLWVLS